ncbi:helix-turn-helix transcriptional regulator [Streptomyces sp. CRN 30]|uniref:helix-turn-helix transcriptional regulator n=1 Tax=Streptomyces sp. CRN 30 TaxID=3075613 RepID=UPI002A83DC66|nr:AAA family ATPase [Streptomyces sp. CRN 30]
MTDPHDPSRLFGRTEDLSFVRSRLSRASGAALLLSGEAGAGKTALLDAVSAHLARDGVRVLRASGAQFETDIGYAGLNQLLLPLLDSFDLLDPAHRDALRVAVGVGGGLPPGRLLTSTAVLLLLRRTAEQTPLCLVVDDLPWLDRATAAVLGFVVRRLAGSRVGFLAAARTGTDSFFDTGALTEHRLRPLDDTDAIALLARAHPAMAPSVRRRIVSEAGGNPLALVELPAALDGDQRAARAPVPAVLPLGERLQALFAARVAALPAPSRDVLLLAALDGTGDLATVEAAAGRPVLDDLGPAERDRLVRVTAFPRHLAFTHPLIGAAVVAEVTAADRRRAHHALADVPTSRPEHRARHLGEATARPDEAVAARLEEAARLRLARGDALGAVAALTRAAELSPRPADVSRRLAEAAYVGADSGGDLTAASRLLAGARRADPGGRRSLHAAAASAFLLLNGEGDIDTAHRLLVGAIESGDHGYEASDEALVDALFTLTMLCWYGGQPRLWQPLLRALDRLTLAPPDLLWVCVQTFGDPALTGPGALPRLERLLADVGSDPTRTVRVGTCSLYPDRLTDSRAASYRLVAEGRAGTMPVRRHIAALIHLAMDHYHSGGWDEATGLADEGLALCAEHGHHYFAGKFRYVGALVAAARGDAETATALADDIARWAAPRGAHGIRALADHARGLAALGQGDAEAAWRHANDLTAPGALAPYRPQALAGTLDLVEAAVRTGRHAEAAAHARAVRNSAMADLSPRLRLLALACEALIVPGEAALPLFERALAADPGHWPFETARVLLLYGERLRRLRMAKEARDHLDAALATFEALDARPWAARARTGPAEATVTGGPALTAQERQIAVLAASGLTNKQIAERLFLSPRTIGSHLYQLYRKLGISSRTALRDALNALDPENAPR